MRRIFKPGLSLFALGALAACGGPVSPPTPPELLCPDGGVTAVAAAKLQTDIIQPTCVAMCHEPGGTGLAQAELDLSTSDLTLASVNKVSIYAGKGGSLKVVDPNHPENSSLWLKVMGGSAPPASYRGPKREPVGGAMPSGKETLTDPEKDEIRAWICSGAN